MALKDTWQNLQDAVAGDPNSGSDITVKPINDIAEAVIDLEDKSDSVDEQIAELKPTIVVEEADVDVASIIMEDNHIFNTQMVLNKLNVDFPEEMAVGYISVLYFVTPVEIPNDYTSFPTNIKFKGDSVEDERFVPEADKIYTVVFGYCGYIVGYVSGVSL